MGSSAAAVVAGVAGRVGAVPGRRRHRRRRRPAAGHRDGGPPRQRRRLPARRGDPGLDGATAARAPTRLRRRPTTSLPVVLVPDAALSTHVARGLLPDAVPHADAAFNAGRAALLVHALTADPALLLDATEDRLHQRQRAAAMPASRALLARLRAAGHAAVVSGAGPSVLVLTRRHPEDRDPATAVRVREIRARPRRVAVLPLEVDRHGASVTGRRVRYRLGNEEHAGAHRCCPVREPRLGSRRSRPLGRASREAEAGDSAADPPHILNPLLSAPPPHARVRTERCTPCAGTRRSPQGRTCT